MYSQIIMYLIVKILLILPSPCRFIHFAELPRLNKYLTADGRNRGAPPKSALAPSQKNAKHFKPPKFKAINCVYA